MLIYGCYLNCTTFLTFFSDPESNLGFSMTLTLFCLLSVLCSIHTLNPLFVLSLRHCKFYRALADYPKFIFVRCLLMIILSLYIFGKNITERMLYSSQCVIWKTHDVDMGYCCQCLLQF